MISTNVNKWVIALCALGVLVGTAAESMAAKKYLSMATSSPGGTFYFMGAGFSQMFNKYDSDVRVITETTASTEENFNLVMRKKVDFGFGGMEIVPAALAAKKDMSGVRMFALGHTSDCHWMVQKDSPVKKLTDFKGKKVVVGPPGSGTIHILKDVLPSCFGFSFDDFTPVYLSWAESVTAMKDNSVDVGLVNAGFPISSVLDLCQNKPIRLISASDEEIKRVTTLRPYFVKVVLPGKTYKGNDADVLTFGVWPESSAGRI